MTNQSKHNSKQQILQATLHLLEMEGIQQTTIRKIAASANVNVAAINYHFGSKNQVITEALKVLRQHFAEAYKHLQTKEIPPKDRLVAFMNVYCNTIFTYPNLIEAFINHNLNSEIEKDYETFVQQEGLILITETIAEILPADPQTLKMKAFQLMSSMILILLLGQDTGSVIGLDFSDEKVRSTYIQMLISDIPD